MCIPELLCPLGVSWLPPAPQPGARLSEKLAASLIFSNFTALKEMGNAGAAAPGKSLAGGVPALHSLSSWDWVTQPCRRLRSLTPVPHAQGRMAAQPALSHPGSLLLSCPEHHSLCWSLLSARGTSSFSQQTCSRESAVPEVER